VEEKPHPSAGDRGVETKTSRSKLASSPARVTSQAARRAVRAAANSTDQAAGKCPTVRDVTLRRERAERGGDQEAERGGRVTDGPGRTKARLMSSTVIAGIASSDPPCAT